MPREKGTPKTGGRAPGTPNKVTKQAKEMLSDFISGEAEHFKTAMGEIYMNDKPLYAALYIKMLPYVLPKLNNIDVTSTNKTALSYEEQLKAMSEEM